MQSRFCFILIFNLASYIVFCQQNNFFNFIPDVGSINGQSRFRGVNSDSNYIYVIGDMVSKQDSDGRNKVVDPMAWVFDYSGNLVSSHKILDTFIPGIRPYGEVISLYPQGNGIFDFMFDALPFEGHPKGAGGYARINMHTGAILKTCKMPVYYLENPRIGEIILNEITWVGDRLIWAQLTSGPNVREQHIMEMDSSFNIVKIIKLEDKLNDTLENHCWINKDQSGIYEVISNALQININNSFKHILIYKKYDTIGNLIKKQVLNTSNINIGINGSLSYNIKKALNKTFLIFGAKIDPKSAKILAPVSLLTSPEFDTLYKSTPMHVDSQAGINLVDYWTYYLEKQMYGDGFIASAAIETSLFAEPDYGVLYKVSNLGDSLWTRKFQPLGWESARASWIKFIQVKETPYHTLVVSAIVADGDENVVKGWLLHLDKDGCLIPGCYTGTNTNLSNKNESTLFEVYPNPISGHLLYLLSRVSAKHCRISLYDLLGNIMETKSLSIEKDVQYLLDIPEKLPNGQYLIKLEIQGQVFTKPIQIMR